MEENELSTKERMMKHKGGAAMLAALLEVFTDIDDEQFSKGFVMTLIRSFADEFIVLVDKELETLKEQETK